MNMDEHEKAMREAAKAPDFEYDGLDGMFHPTLTTMECNGLLKLIREQVRRMDETCAASSTLCNGVKVVIGCKDVVNANCVYCPTCGKRIKQQREQK